MCVRKVRGERERWLGGKGGGEGQERHNPWSPIGPGFNLHSVTLGRSHSFSDLICEMGVQDRAARSWDVLLLICMLKNQITLLACLSLADHELGAGCLHVTSKLNI